MVSQPELLFETPLNDELRVNQRDRLAHLLAGELDFHGERSGYASHDLHAFAAKFPPQLPRTFIRELTAPGDTVLDPMMGSGTTLVEAVLEGRRSIGLDLDPLALRLVKAKTKTGDVFKFKEAGEKVISDTRSLLQNKAAIEREFAARYDNRTREFINYWFLPATQTELTALMLAIEKVEDAQTRQFLELVFSSIIITKSGGVSRARDLAHSRPHLDRTKIPKSAIEQFTVRLRKKLTSIVEVKSDSSSAFALSGDARTIPLCDETIDLIVTSPPYANALDYMRAHKFSLVWLGYRVEDLTKLRAKYIGSERTVDKVQIKSLPERAEATIERLAQRDRKKSAILQKYFAEMRDVIHEMYRVLKPGASAIVVVGTSTMRGLDVQTHLCLADIGLEEGFDVVGITERRLDRNKRMMPARFGKKSDSIIEQRMHEEYVIGFYKPVTLANS